jgi:hypothetical protein
MHNKRFAAAELAMSSLLAVMAFLSGAAVEPASAQTTNAVPHVQAENSGLSAPPPFVNTAPATMPPPTFNLSSPYTVPQSPETPVSPSSPGSIFGN